MKKILNNYSLNIPDGWKTESNETSDSIFDPNGNGAITISSYTSAEESNPEQALKKFISVPAEIKVTNINGYNIASSEYNDQNGRHIYASAIIKNKILILASYNCLPDNISSPEIEVVKNIISSIELE